MQLPSWVWLLAVLLGVFFAGSSLSYAPLGRINVLWIWLLWAGLPLVGSIVSLWLLCFGREQPWLFRWRTRRVHWYPSPQERLHMLATLQQLWLVLGGGILLGYLSLLLFTDLAFGWSSTLVDDAQQIAGLSRMLATPWAWCWPTAVPNIELVEATRYTRINPQMAQVHWAGRWWQFLLASLLVYNLLPRLLLSALAAFLLRWHSRRALHVRAPIVSVDAEDQRCLRVDELAHWQAAIVLRWELPMQDAGEFSLGLADWQADEQTLQDLLKSHPKQLHWQVNASRSPVAELADLIALARQAGVQQQALQPIANTTTDPRRHIASWRAFADQQQLAWLEEVV
jgi:hypothetical protein